jgi:putative phosphoesterase
MKLAFISDIHANLPALQAVLADIDTHQPDDIYCLGDLVNFAGWDNEVIDLVRSKGITTVQGNHDEGIGHLRQDFQFSWSTEEQRVFGVRSALHAMSHLTVANRAYLRNLPFSVQMEYRFPFHPCRIILVHGSPVSNNDYIQPEAPDEVLRELLEIASADILLTGHTHRPFHRTLYMEEQNQKLYRHVINAGSVGKTKHGNPAAIYATLEIRQELHMSDPDAVAVKFHEVLYDIEAVIQHIHASGQTDAYDKFLRQGK